MQIIAISPITTPRGILIFERKDFGLFNDLFKVFVTWLAQVQELPTEKQYRIHFMSNPNMHWQRRSLAALSCFAVDLVTIET